jgi:hypothetical protein
MHHSGVGDACGGVATTHYPLPFSVQRMVTPQPCQAAEFALCLPALPRRGNRYTFALGSRPMASASGRRTACHIFASAIPSDQNIERRSGDASGARSRRAAWGPSGFSDPLWRRTAGASMSKRRKKALDERSDDPSDAVTLKRRPASPAPREPEENLSPPDSGERELPIWIASEGNLHWKETVILHLATWAHTERAILDAFQKAKWRPVIADPFDRDTVGHDPTQSRRSALHNLNRRLGKNSPIAFFSTHDGQIGWEHDGSRS